MKPFEFSRLQMTPFDRPAGARRSPPAPAVLVDLVIGEARSFAEFRRPLQRPMDKSSVPQHVLPLRENPVPIPIARRR